MGYPFPSVKSVVSTAVSGIGWLDREAQVGPSRSRQSKTGATSETAAARLKKGAPGFRPARADERKAGQNKCCTGLLKSSEAERSRLNNFSLLPTIAATELSIA
jgi:hypothetical protein